MADSDSIFPLVDRQTPMMDRLRNRNGASKKNTPNKMAQLLAKTVPSDGAVRQQTAAEFADEFEKALASELGVEVDDLNPEIADMFEQMLVGINPDELFTDEAAREQGLLDNDDEPTGDLNPPEDEQEDEDELIGDSEDEEEDEIEAEDGEEDHSGIV